MLRRRAYDGALELRVNGVFVMDTRETGTERLLAELSLADLPANRGLKVLVGGLGLGFTLAAVLRDERVGTVIVAEIEPSLVGWHEQGIVPGSGIGDQRVEVVTGDAGQGRRRCVRAVRRAGTTRPTWPPRHGLPLVPRHLLTRRPHR